MGFSPVLSTPWPIQHRIVAPLGGCGTQTKDTAGWASSLQSSSLLYIQGKKKKNKTVKDIQETQTAD